MPRIGPRGADTGVWGVPAPGMEGMFCVAERGSGTWTGLAEQQDGGTGGALLGQGVLYGMAENVTASLLAGVPTADITEYGEEN